MYNDSMFLHGVLNTYIYIHALKWEIHYVYVLSMKLLEYRKFLTKVIENPNALWSNEVGKRIRRNG